jgi:sugar lactone lactonase YvrE
MSHCLRPKGIDCMSSYEHIDCTVAAGDICGEGAVWHNARAALYWTDINRFLVHEFAPDQQTTRTWLFGEPVTSVNLTNHPDLFLLVFASKVGLWNPKNHPKVDTLYRLESAPEMRFNDAGVDPAGVLWAGTMANNVGPDGEEVAADFKDGVLYRIDARGRATEWKHHIGISNTVAWSPDSAKFYFGDTIANSIYVYDYDSRTGTPCGEKRLLGAYPYGVPDGSAMDEEGFLWNARAGAGRIIRIAPDGRVDRVVDLPVKNPTTCAFGGAELDTLYITTARSTERLSGSVFALKPGPKGIPAGRFRVR